MNPQAFAKSSLLRILLALAVLLGVAFATVKQADRLLGKALAGAFGSHQSEYESVWFDWSGNVTARNVALRPHDLHQAAELRFDRVWLETPGWSFFLRHAFDRELQDAKFPQLHLVFGEATETGGLEAMLPEFGPVGPASGAMFEAAGCPASRGFTHEQLMAMGLSVGPTSLELEQRLEGDAVFQRYAIDTPGSSRTQLERNGTLDGPRDSLLDTRLSARVESERWRVRDQGFVPARNRHCARQAGVEPREFPELHIAAIDHFMQRAGLAVDENSRAFYRRFARSGGEMSFGGAYQPPLGAEESLDERDDGRALARMDATLERDTRAVPIVWRQVPVVGAPEEDEPAGASSIAVTNPAAANDPGAPVSTGRNPAANTSVNPSGSAPSTPVVATPANPSGAPAPAPTAPSSTNPAVPTTTVPSSTSAPIPAANAPSANTPVPAATAPPTDTVPVPTASAPSANTPASSATAPPSDHTPAPAASTNLPNTADPAPPSDVRVPATPTEAPSAASTRPAANPTRPAASRPSTGPRIERAPPLTRRETLGWDDLPRHRGERLRLWTVHNPPRTVELLEISGDTARVRARLGGGHAEYTVQRSGFIKATSIR